MSNEPDVIREALEAVRSWDGLHDSLPHSVVAKINAAFQALDARDASQAGEGEGGAVRDDLVSRLEAEAIGCRAIAVAASVDLTTGTRKAFEFAADLFEEAAEALSNPPPPIQAAGVGRETIKRVIFDHCSVDGYALQGLNDAADEILALLPQPDQSPSAALDALCEDEREARAVKEQLRSLFMDVMAAKRGEKPQTRNPIVAIVNLVPKVLAVLDREAEFQRDAAAEELADSPSQVAAPAGWRDIKDAPRDGTAVDLKSGNVIVERAHWGLCDVSSRPHGYFAWVYAPTDFKPTHFRLCASPPLPASIRFDPND